MDWLVLHWPSAPGVFKPTPGLRGCSGHPWVTDSPTSASQSLVACCAGCPDLPFALLVEPSAARISTPSPAKLLLTHPVQRELFFLWPSGQCDIDQASSWFGNVTGEIPLRENVISLGVLACCSVLSRVWDPGVCVYVCVCTRHYGCMCGCGCRCVCTWLCVCVGVAT